MPKGVRPPNAGKGRPKGSVNKTTKSAREAFQLAYDTLQAPGTSLAEWAMANTTEFYKLYARLIPVEHVGTEGGPIATVVRHIYESTKTP